MTVFSKFTGTVLCAGLIAFAGAGQSAPASFGLTYNGDTVGAFAMASITLDDVIFGGSYSEIRPVEDFEGDGITAFSITVDEGIGAITYGLSDFAEFVFSSSGPLNGNVDLVGQANFQDFNIFSSNLAGLNPNIFDTNGGTVFTLTSFAPSSVTAPVDSTVPVPAAGGLLLFGLGALGLRRRRSQ